MEADAGLGAFSLLPIILALVLAFVTKDTVRGLCTGPGQEQICVADSLVIP